MKVKTRLKACRPRLKGLGPLEHFGASMSGPPPPRYSDPVWENDFFRTLCNFYLPQGLFISHCRTRSLPTLPGRTRLPGSWDPRGWRWHHPSLHFPSSRTSLFGTSGQLLTPSSPSCPGKHTLFPLHSRPLTLSPTCLRHSQRHLHSQGELSRLLTARGAWLMGTGLSFPLYSAGH